MRLLFTCFFYKETLLLHGIKLSCFHCTALGITSPLRLLYNILKCLRPFVYCLFPLTICPKSMSMISLIRVPNGLFVATLMIRENIPILKFIYKNLSITAFNKIVPSGSDFVFKLQNSSAHAEVLILKGVFSLIATSNITAATSAEV